MSATTFVAFDLPPHPYDVGVTHFPNFRLGRAMCVGLCALLLTTGSAFGQSKDVERERDIEEADGRIKGVDASNDTVLGSDGVGTTYLAFLGMTILAVGVMFKSARRSHLD